MDSAEAQVVHRAGRIIHRLGATYPPLIHRSVHSPIHSHPQSYPQVWVETGGFLLVVTGDAAGREITATGSEPRRAAG